MGGEDFGPKKMVFFFFKVFSNLLLGVNTQGEIKLPFFFP